MDCQAADRPLIFEELTETILEGRAKMSKEEKVKTTQREKRDIAWFLHRTKHWTKREIWLALGDLSIDVLGALTRSLKCNVEKLDGAIFDYHKKGSKVA